MHLFLLLLDLLFVWNSMVHAETVYGKECRTPSNEIGRCMPTESCGESITESGGISKASCSVDNDLSYVCCRKDKIHLNDRGLKILQNTTCGPLGLPKISNGLEAALFVFPWMALLKYRSDRFRCAGSLISDRYVLSAAHCVENADDPVVEVRLGEYRISTERDCMRVGSHEICAPPVEDIGIEKILLPPERKTGDYHNDVALIRLLRNVELTKEKKHIRPVCLPITEELRSEMPEDYIVSGWGGTGTQSSSDVLLYTRLPNRKLEDCEKTFGLIGLTEREICAGGEELRDTCAGDSGGPLSYPSTYNGNQTRMVQYGIVSAGILSCGRDAVPAIYMSVPLYMQWISDYLEM